MTNSSSRTFQGNAQAYHQQRPPYASSLYPILIHYWKNLSSSTENLPLILDVGCGTGIATRGLYDALKGQCQMYGIDPDITMLEQAKQASSNEQRLHYQVGSADDLNFAPQSVDIIMVAQAIQYIDRHQFYSKAQQLLRSQSGVIAILENNRDWRHSPFLSEYEAFLERYSIEPHGQTYSRDYRAYPLMSELKTHFNEPEEHEARWTIRLQIHEVLQLIASTSSAQVAFKHLGTSRAEKMIHDLIQDHLAADGRMDIPYCSKLYLAHV